MARPLNWSEEADFDTMLVKQQAKVRNCGSIAELFEAMGLDWFAAY